MIRNPVLRCEGLYRSFGGVQALEDVSLELPLSGTVAVIGPNGAGKTTLVNAFTGFIRPDAGRCFMGDEEITDLPPHKIARLGIARTFQDLRLVLQLSALENVLLARPHQRGERLLDALLRIRSRVEAEGDREEARSILDLVGLKQDAQKLAAELSYGQQKLLTLACCMATGAGILLLDEPVAGVYPELASSILDLLKTLAGQGKLVLFIEHDISAVRKVADAVIVMDEGRIIAQGSPADVLERPEILEAYLA